MLQNNFFEIISVTKGEKYLVDIRMHSDHEIYKGHFPGNPIAPGVCLIQIVKESIEHISGSDLLVVRGDNIKFLAILNPNEHSSVNLQMTLKMKEDGLTYADASISSGEIIFFNFKGSFKLA